MNNLVLTNENSVEEVKTIPSYEVAEMMEAKHNKVLRMLEGDKTHIGIIPTLRKAQLGLSEYFIESTYKTEGNNKTYKYYECTKLGCDMLANKMTGEKGILFTARYVKRFNDMQQAIRQQAAVTQDMIAQVISQQITPLLEKIDDLQNTMLKLNDPNICKGTKSTTEIAKKYNMSAVQLNKILEKKHVIYRNENNKPRLSERYKGRGYEALIPIPRENEFYIRWKPEGEKFIDRVMEYLSKEKQLTF